MPGPTFWIALVLAQAASPPTAPSSPRPVDPRLVFEEVAREPRIVTPTGIAVDAKGRVFAIESHTHFRPKDYKGPPADRIRLFEDPDGSGRFSSVRTFFEGTRMTMNLAFDRAGTLFVASRSAIYRLEDLDGDGRADGEAATRVPAPLVRLDTPGDYPHNGLSGFAFDDQGRVYFGLGENLGAEYRLIGSDGTTYSGGGEGGNIYRCRPDGSKLERIATGFWNPFHVAFDAAGQLFAVDNDPDSRPPCRLLHIVEGGDYGYRFRNGRKGLHPFTSWNGELPGTLPMVAGTGEAPSGVLSYQAANLPDEYRGTLLVTSWGDHRIERYRLQPHGASFRATMEPVVVGGEDFRPVGIAVAPDGSLFFTDWVDRAYELHGKGRIWRLRGRTPGPGGAVVATLPEAVKHAQTLRTAGAQVGKDELLRAVESDDPFLQQAAREGLKRTLSREELLALARDRAPARRLAAVLILREVAAPEARSLVPGLLDDPDPAIRFAAIQWVGEEHLSDLRPRLLAQLASENASRQVLEATVAALELLDARRRGPREELSGADYMASLLAAEGSSDATRARALRMIPADHPSLTLPRLRKLMESPLPSLRLEAVRTLATGPLPQRFAILGRLADDPNAPADQRAWAILGLADDAANRKARLLALAVGQPAVLRREALRSLSGVALSAVERTVLVSGLGGDPQAIELLDRLDPSSPPRSGGSSVAARPAGNDLDGWLRTLDGPADAAAGARVFFHPKGPGCFRCHEVDGRGGRVGPELSRLGRGMDRRRLVQSILQPSAEIAPQFVNWSVARTDGTVFSGILLVESQDGKQSYADAEGRIVVVPSSEIEDRKPQSTSIMPDNVTQTLTVQEFRDLVAFLTEGRK